ncbi:MAG: M48 family metalloprotease [Cuniculiplasma sp.]
MVFVIPFLFTFFLLSHISPNSIIRSIYVDTFFLFLFSVLLWNPFLSKWKRRSKPIENQEMATAIFVLSKKLNVKITEVRVIDWKQAKVANAFQTGLRTYYLFISNYLYENLNYDENLSVLAHEMAHASKNHLRKTLLFEETISFCAINIFLLTPIFFKSVAVQLSLIIIGLALIIIGLNLFIPTLKRKYEKEADISAAMLTSPDSLIRALIKLSDLNLIPLKVSKLWNYSHPDMNTRIRYLKEVKGERI